MNQICRDIFKAIHEGKWMKIEYRNKADQITKYWIGIRDLDCRKGTLKVDGLHLGQYTIGEYDRIYINSILSTEVIEGTYCPINEKLVEDIAMHPERYKNIFSSSANLKILNYLEICNRLDTTPYITDYELIQYIDADRVDCEKYQLTDQQFREVVANFQYKLSRDKQNCGNLRIKKLALNVLSVHTSKGLYVLAYRNLNLDVKYREFRPDKEITVCTQFTIEGQQESVRKFLDADEYELLNDFEANLEKIKDAITEKGQDKAIVDDIPYVIGLGMDVVLNLHEEYKSILDMFEKDNVIFPIKAFFGELLERPRRNKTYPIALINQNINLDQLLAINNAMKYPLAYIQGPPGTGKTNTIMNTIITAFFNSSTVLFASYNNVPIDNVFEKLSSMQYHGKMIPFPVLRLGNIDKVKEAIQYINRLRKQVETIKIFESTLDKRKDDRIDRAKRLSSKLKEYEEILDLKERKETLSHLMKYQERTLNTMNLLSFQSDLQGYQMKKIEGRIASIGEISDQDAMQLLDRNEEEFFQYLFYTSAKYIKMLEETKYQDLRRILDSEEEPDKKAQAFNRYLQDSDNVKKLQRVFPVMITTCISAHKLGNPEPLFDMTIIDEASQCNVAISLVPIIRGSKLMLVGDPQQLNPVILLDDISNQKLRRKYHIADEYDYVKNSIYKTYLACDAVSDEVLLRNHYRCNKKIIGFNNKKYYNSKLQIKTKSEEPEPLVYIDVKNDRTDIKNTSPAEVYEVLEYALHNKDKSIAVITPFVNQKNLIEQKIKENKLDNLVCGTVHAFQGDEKDVVLFSTALSERTGAGTYQWLKNNKELINVATSRAKDKLIMLASSKDLKRLHNGQEDDDLYELAQYIRTNGKSQITEKHASSRALGIQPFSTATENAFLENLTHALENIWLSQSKYVIHKEVAISQVFRDDITHDDLFYMGRFDFVVYEKQGKSELPILAIELDGKEHFEDEVVKERDRKKNAICKAHNVQIIRVENSYARRYNHIKGILLDYFSRVH